MQTGIVERARQHANRLEDQRMHHRMHLPEAEMAGEEEHALPLRVGGAHALLAVDDDPRAHRLGRQPAETQ